MVEVVKEIVEKQNKLMKQIENKLVGKNEETPVIDEETENWLIPPEDRASSKNNTKFILDVIQDKKITFPAEITTITGFSRQTVFDKLAKLTYSGVLEKIDIATTRTPPVELKRRLPELWATGLKGNAIKRMSWYRMNTDVKEPISKQVQKQVD